MLTCYLNSNSYFVTVICNNYKERIWVIWPENAEGGRERGAERVIACKRETTRKVSFFLGTSQGLSRWLIIFV